MVRSKYSSHYAIGLIILLAFFVRMWNISGPDIATDDSLYSFRALGWMDYVASENKQSTPLTWFKDPQWWQGYSFHDAPFLVFLIQWIFFKIGGDSVLFARLPFLLAGIFSILGIYLLGKYLFNKFVGLSSALILSVLNFHIWVSRIGFLEGFVILWSIYAIYFFLRAEERPKYYLWWGIFLGLAAATKYTSFFLFPLFFIYFIFWRKKIFREKWFYFGFLAFFAVILPIIIYNFMMFETRGHFDAALSTIFGMKPEDFRGLVREFGGTSMKKIFSESIPSNLKNFSWGMRISILFGLISLFWLSYKNFRKYYFVLGGFIFSFLAVIAVGASDRFMPIILPFIVLALGILFSELWEKYSLSYKYPAIIIAVLILLFELIYGIQNQVLAQPIIKNDFFVGGVRPSWQGYGELENFVHDFYEKHPGPSYIVFASSPQILNWQIKKVESIMAHPDSLPQQKHLLVFDDRMSWAPSVWIFERRRLYDIATIPSLSQFIRAISKDGGKNFAGFGFEDVTIITTTDFLERDKIDGGEINENYIKKLSLKFQPVENIERQDGKTVFRVFELPLSEAVNNL